jgi:hypothetical protein
MRSRTANWFLCKIRYEKVMEDGLQKKVTEQYVVDALSFTEAEARIMEQMSQYISGEFEVVEIDRCVFHAVFFMSYGEKVLDNETKDLMQAVRKGDKEQGKKVYNRTLEESLNNTDTYYFKAKLHFITIDEKTEKEKKSVVNYLVEGCSLESARKNIDEVMRGTMIDYRIAAVSETNIMDVFEYVAKEDSRPKFEK